METGGNGHDAGLPSVASRYLRHSLFLAVVTGFGLVASGGLDGLGPWLFFGLATLVAVTVPWTLLRARGSTEPHVAPFSGEVAASADRIPAPSLANPERQSHPDLDEIDYLRALRHEFRTPLNAVLGFSDVLLSGIDGEINDSQREDLEIIRASGIRLRVLLDSALDISQLAEGELRLDLERVDVRDLVSRAAAEVGQLWSNKREASFSLPEGRCIAEADEARLRRSIVVLADFLATNHRDAEISLAVAPLEEHVAIEITARATERLTLDALPTPAEVLAAEDVTKIRQWPVAVTSELIGKHGGSLYHGSAPSRFLIRLPVGGMA